jgi:hypothetical protein
MDHQLPVDHRHHVHMLCSVNRDVVDGGEQNPAFQILDRGSKRDATYFSFAIARIDNILGRHGPSWAKRPTLGVFSNALPELETSTRRARGRLIARYRQSTAKP